MHRAAWEIIAWFRIVIRKVQKIRKGNDVLKLYSEIVSPNLSMPRGILYGIGRRVINIRIRMYLLWTMLKKASCRTEICLFYNLDKVDHHYTGLFISPSGISELDCATTKTDTAERSISIGTEFLQVFFLY